MSITGTRLILQQNHSKFEDRISKISFDLTRKFDGYLVIAFLFAMFHIDNIYPDLHHFFNSPEKYDYSILKAL